MLVTSGATREAIDGVRFITNLSTGATGAALADAFSGRGHRVTYLHGQDAAQPQGAAARAAFTDFQDLDSRLRSLLAGRRFDLIVHLAAVSDYSVAAVLVDGRRQAACRLAKRDSRAEVQVALKRNFKILDRLPRYAVGRPLIVGFKLTHTADADAARRAAAALQADLVVHNDVRDRCRGRIRKFRIYESGVLKAQCRSRADLARRLCDLAQRRLDHASRP